MPVLLHLVLVQSDKLKMKKEGCFQPLSEEKAEWTTIHYITKCKVKFNVDKEQTRCIVS